MSLSLRAKLRLTESCSEAELRDTCNRYYTIYNGVLASATSEDVKAVAAAKLDDLVRHARAEGIVLDSAGGVSYESGAANIAASIEAELSSGSRTLSSLKIAQLHKMIAALPPSAKRYYLSALVTLQKPDDKMDYVREAVKKLESACTEDPENIVYRTLLLQIREEIKGYNAELEAFVKRRTEEINKEKFWSAVKAFFSGLWTVITWVGGALLVIGGGIASCVCGACDAC